MEAHRLNGDYTLALTIHHVEQNLLQALQFQRVLDGLSFVRDTQHNGHPTTVSPYLQQTNCTEELSNIGLPL